MSTPNCSALFETAPIHEGVHLHKCSIWDAPSISDRLYTLRTADVFFYTCLSALNSWHHVQGHSGLLEEDRQGRGVKGFLQGRLVKRVERNGRRFCTRPVRRDQEVHIKSDPDPANQAETLSAVNVLIRPDVGRVCKSEKKQPLHRPLLNLCKYDQPEHPTPLTPPLSPSSFLTLGAEVLGKRRKRVPIPWKVKHSCVLLIKTKSENTMSLQLFSYINFN